MRRNWLTPTKRRRRAREAPGEARERVRQADNPMLRDAGKRKPHATKTLPARVRDAAPTPVEPSPIPHELGDEGSKETHANHSNSEHKEHEIRQGITKEVGSGKMQKSQVRHRHNTSIAQAKRTRDTGRPGQALILGPQVPSGQSQQGTRGAPETH